MIKRYAGRVGPASANEAIIKAGTFELYGSAEFAVSDWERDVTTPDGPLVGAKVHSIAVVVQDAQVKVSPTLTIGVAGSLAIAKVTPAVVSNTVPTASGGDQAAATPTATVRYSALKLSLIHI